MDRIRQNNSKNIDGTEASNMLCQVKCQDPQTLQDLIAFETHLESKRTEQLNALAEFVSQIQDRLHTLKIEVRGDFTMEIRDADYYRVNMFQLEGKINQMKECVKDELCSLIKEETELSKELQSIERRVEEWSKPLNARIFKPAINSIYRSQSQDDEDDPPGEFQKFILNSGGHSGGWEEQDHLLFLRERRKYSGKQKFISVIHCLLPDISEDEIVAHETWYKKYETLKHSQREAIRKWKASKVAVREQYLEPQVDEREAERTRPKNPGYQRDIADRIKEWKRQQMIKKAEEEERQREEQHRQHEERLRKRESQKNVVEHYKTEKLNRVQAEILQVQMRELQALEDRARKSVLLKAFREQDQQFVERKKQARVQSALKEKERIERLENVKPCIDLTVERDPQRVLQPTHVWNQHCLQHDTLTRPKVINLQTIPHLAVPAWRKGLSNV